MLSFMSAQATMTPHPFPKELFFRHELRDRSAIKRGYLPAADRLERVREVGAR